MHVRHLITLIIGLAAFAPSAVASGFGGGGELDEYEDANGVVIVAGKPLAVDARTRVEDEAGRRLSHADIDRRVGRYVRFRAVPGYPHARATLLAFERFEEDPSEPE